MWVVLQDITVAISNGNMDDFELELAEQDVLDWDDVLDHSFFSKNEIDEYDEMGDLMEGEAFTSDHLLREL